MEYENPENKRKTKKSFRFYRDSKTIKMKDFSDCMKETKLENSHPYAKVLMDQTKNQ